MEIFQYGNISFEKDVDGLIHTRIESTRFFDIAFMGGKWIGVFKAGRGPYVYFDLHGLVECLLYFLTKEEHSMKQWRVFTGFAKA